jgi:hypothetical protein
MGLAGAEVHRQGQASAVSDVAAVDLEQDVLVHTVVVPDVVRRPLIPPDDAPVLGIDGEDGVGEELAPSRTLPS